MSRHTLDTSRLVVFGDSLSDNGNLLRLLGQLRPPFSEPPYFDGRISNGPTYAEQLAQWLNVPLQDLAFGLASALDVTPPQIGRPLPINLPEQVAGYLAGLNGKQAPDDTTAVIYIGGNDYGNYLGSNLPKDLPTAEGIVGNVIASIGQAIGELSAAGVEKIALFTLPDFAFVPEVQALGPLAGLAEQLDEFNNAGLRLLTASNPNVELVDIFKLSDTVAADPLAFGLSDMTVPLIDLVASNSTEFAPNEVGFTDGEHPTFAGHGIQAAFADATLSSDRTLFLDGTQSVVHAEKGSNFIFATPIDPTNPSLDDNYTIYGGSGSDLIFAGSGNVTVHGGSGTELIDAGSGNAKLFAGDGTDLLATNSLGTNLPVGGDGNDALIANRGGTNTILGGDGNDLIVLKESASLVDPGGSFSFGTQTIAGGDGRDTLRFIINDQIPGAEQALMAEFHQVQAAFDASVAAHHPGTFQVDGLDVTGIDQLQLQVDSVSTDPATPYLITQNIVASDGHGAAVSDKLDNLLTTASHWGLLTV